MVPLKLSSRFRGTLAAERKRSARTKCQLCILFASFRPRYLKNKNAAPAPCPCLTIPYYLQRLCRAICGPCAIARAERLRHSESSRKAWEKWHRELCASSVAGYQRKTRTAKVAEGVRCEMRHRFSRGVAFCFKPFATALRPLRSLGVSAFKNRPHRYAAGVSAGSTWMRIVRRFGISSLRIALTLPVSRWALATLTSLGTCMCMSAR